MGSRTRELRTAIVRAARAGRSFDQIGAEIIERSGQDGAMRGALYYFAFAQLPPEEQERIVRENFVVAETQLAAFN